MDNRLKQCVVNLSSKGLIDDVDGLWLAAEKKLHIPDESHA